MEDSKKFFYRSLGILVWLIIILIIVFVVLYFIGSYNLVNSDFYRDYQQLLGL